jgi:hypothetical protein
MLTQKRLEELRFQVATASNGNRYLYKGKFALFPFGFGWNFGSNHGTEAINTYSYIETEDQLVKVMQA